MFCFSMWTRVRFVTFELCTFLYLCYTSIKSWVWWLAVKHPTVILLLLFLGTSLDLLLLWAGALRSISRNVLKLGVLTAAAVWAESRLRAPASGRTEGSSRGLPLGAAAL